MSTAITPKERMETLRGMLVKAKDSFATVLPKHITPDRMLKVAMVAATKQPKLLEPNMDLKSVVMSVMTASELGLDCSGRPGGGSLVPFYNSKRGCLECIFIPDYRGLIDLAIRSGKVTAIYAHEVYEKDTFEVDYGLNQTLVHHPCFLDDPGAMVAAYAVAIMKDGPRTFEVVLPKQIAAIKRTSKSPAWKDPESEPAMWRKTAVRRLCNWLPQSAELQRALEIEDRVDAGESPAMGMDFINAEFEIEAAEPEKTTDKVAEKLKAKRRAVAEEEPQEQPELFEGGETPVEPATE